MLFSELIRQETEPSRPEGWKHLESWRLVKTSRKGNLVYELFYDQALYNNSLNPYSGGHRYMWYYRVVVSSDGRVLQKELTHEDDYDF